MERRRTGQLIREARERAGLTQLELSDRVLVSRTIVTKWESGKLLPQVPDQVNALAAALPLSIEELLRAMGVNIVPAAAARLPRELVTALLAMTPAQHAALLEFSRPILEAKGRQEPPA